MMRIVQTLDLIQELLQEVVDGHSDPDSPDYNECDKPGEMCMWCDNALKAIDEIKK